MELRYEGMVRAAFETWGLALREVSAPELPTQVAHVRDSLAELADGTGIVDMKMEAVAAFDAGLRGEATSPEARSVVTCLMQHLYGHRDDLANVSLSAQGLLVWRDNPEADQRLECADCRFLVPAVDGDGTGAGGMRTKIPCLPRCPECGGEFVECPDGV